MYKKNVYFFFFLFLLFLSCNNGGSGDWNGIVLKVTYEANGADRGVVPRSQKSSIVADNIGGLIKDGYLFDGWNTSPDGQGTSYSPGSNFIQKTDKYSTSITLYAKWVPIFLTSSISQNAPSLNSNSIACPSENSFLTIIGLTEKGKQLTDITIPSSIDGNRVTSISSRAFVQCTNIERIIFSEEITNIGTTILSGCSNLKKIFFQGSIPPVLSTGALNGCSAKVFVPSESVDNYKQQTSWQAYTSIIFVDDIEIFLFEIVNNKIIITGLTEYGQGLISLNIPRTIGKYPVTTIGTAAFFECTGLTGGLIIPDSITTIEDYAFYGCTGFTDELFLGNGVAFIGRSAFNRCSFKGNLIIPNSVITIGDYAFYDCDNFDGNLVLGKNIINIGKSAFGGCGGFIGSLVIPDKVLTIEEFAFHGCYGFTGGLIIPDSVINIGESAFDGCSGFSGNLILGRCITNIGKKTFYGCYGLSGELNIPDSIVNIGEMALNYCCAFTALRVKKTIPPQVGPNLFSDDQFVLIYVPSSAVNTYKTAPGWSIYSNNIQGF
ncbi:MAG: leucine-rich repeat protein [Spirochaetia bacterium]|nr:leucine-rich repeat protein [Spirochaetia bacterium]